jgi:hypothetical protein
MTAEPPRLSLALEKPPGKPGGLFFLRKIEADLEDITNLAMAEFRQLNQPQSKRRRN